MFTILIIIIKAKLNVLYTNISDKCFIIYNDHYYVNSFNGLDSNIVELKRICYTRRK